GTFGYGARRIIPGARLEQRTRRASPRAGDRVHGRQRPPPGRIPALRTLDSAGGTRAGAAASARCPAIHRVALLRLALHPRAHEPSLDIPAAIVGNREPDIDFIVVRTDRAALIEQRIRRNDRRIERLKAMRARRYHQTEGG